MRLKNYKVIKTYFQRDGLSIHLATDVKGDTYFLRLLDGKKNPCVSTEKWYELYDDYQLTITNYKHLPRVHSIDSYETGQVFSTFSFVQGQFINAQNLLNQEEVEELLDAVSNLHAKGLVHGGIRPENIWMTDVGKIILFGAGEERAFGKEGLTKEADFQQLIEILSNYSALQQEQIHNLQRLNCNDVEDIRRQLLNPTISPGLVEKEKKAPGLPSERVERKLKKQAPTPNPSTQKNQNEVPLKKRPLSKWILVGATTVIVLSGAVLGGIEIGAMKTVKPALPASSDISKAKAVNKVKKPESAHPNPSAKTTEPELPKTNDPGPLKTTAQVKVDAPPFDQAALNVINPGWQLIKSQVVSFPDNDKVVAEIAQGTTLGKVMVLQYDFTSKSWLNKWSGDISDAFYAFTSLFVTESNSQKRALVLATANTGIGQNFGEALAFTIDDNGTCTLQEKLHAANLTGTQEGNSLIVNGDRQLGMRKLSLNGEQYVDIKIPASQQSPAEAVQVTFKLDDNGNVVAAQSNMLNMKVGQSIAFIPVDNRTKQEFDQGNIGIYTDAGGGTLGTYDADAIWSGNSYKFDKEGFVQFLLVKNDAPVNINSTPTATFTINVTP